MNLRQLELFIAVAESASFSRGAALVGLTQSTASQHIAALEEEVGSSLIDRTTKGALLTASGKIFARHARRILAERDALFQSMSGFQGLKDVQLLIGASNIPANYLIPPILPQLAEQYPGISLTMTAGDSLDILNSLNAAEVELAVVGSRFDHKGVEYQPLVEDRLALIVGPQHRWRNRRTISVEELKEEPFVVREVGSGSGKTFETSLHAAGFDPNSLKITARLGSNEAIQQAVSAGYGCAFVSEFSIRQRLNHKEIFHGAQQ